MKDSTEFLQLYARATLRARHNIGQLSKAIYALELAIKLRNPQHIRRCIKWIKLHGGVV